MDFVDEHQRAITATTELVLGVHQAETGVLVGWVAPTGLLLLICFFTLAFYPLTGEPWEKIKKELASKHRQKEKAYLEQHGFQYVEEKTDRSTQGG